MYQIKNENKIAFISAFIVFLCSFFFFVSSARAFEVTTTDLQWKIMGIDYSWNWTSQTYIQSQNFCVSTYGSTWRLPTVDEIHIKWIKDLSFVNNYNATSSLYGWLLDDNPYNSGYAYYFRPMPAYEIISGFSASGSGLIPLACVNEVITNINIESLTDQMQATSTLSFLGYLSAGEFLISFFLFFILIFLFFIVLAIILRI